METTGEADSAAAYRQGIAAGLVLSCGLTLIDWLDLFRRVRFASVTDALLFGAASASALLTAGAASGAVAVAVARSTARFTRHRAHPAVASALVSLPLAAGGLFVFASWLEWAWRSFTVIERSLVIAVAVVGLPAFAFLVAYLLAFAPARRSGTRRVAVAGGAALVGSSLLVAHRLFDTLPKELHALLALEAVLAFAVALEWTWPSARGALNRPRRAAACLALGVGTLVALEAADVRPPASTDALFYGKLVLALRRATDVDGDGSSSLFGGRDCRAFDPRFAPSRTDVPENGLDENCSGSDARRRSDRPRAPYPVPNARGFNVVWLGIDALRADHVGAYGYARRTTPNIDRLASSGLRFERAFVQATSTWDSVPSMLTGRYPHRLPRDYGHPKARLGKRWYSYTLGAEAPLVSELVAATGYTTAGFAAFRVFDPLDLASRFQSYERTGALREEAERFIARTKEPFLLWQHLPYPHEPYVEQPRFDFGADTIARYDGEIAFADSVVGAIFAALERRGVADRTIVILTADHGEAFGEHGKRFHGRSCYVEQTRVPLVVRVPGLDAAVVRAPVELVDVVPTLLELLGIARGSLALDGESLLRALAEPAPFAERGAYCEYFRSGVTLQSLTFDDWKIISDIERDSVELYALARDQGELVNVERREPAVRDRLLDALGARYSLR
ncbi:MAG TPA: sulfatase [Polyangiaceae bacterium]